MNIYDLTAKTRKGDDFKLSSLKGKVSLVVNTATGCGFTPQYEGLENLYKKYDKMKSLGFKLPFMIDLSLKLIVSVLRIKPPPNTIMLS